MSCTYLSISGRCRHVHASIAGKELSRSSPISTLRFYASSRLTLWRGRSRFSIPVRHPAFQIDSRVKAGSWKRGQLAPSDTELPIRAYFVNIPYNFNECRGNTLHVTICVFPSFQLWSRHSRSSYSIRGVFWKDVQIPHMGLKITGLRCLCGEGREIHLSRFNSQKRTECGCAGGRRLLRGDAQVRPATRVRTRRGPRYEPRLTPTSGDTHTEKRWGRGWGHCACVRSLGVFRTRPGCFGRVTRRTARSSLYAAEPLINSG